MTWAESDWPECVQERDWRGAAHIGPDAGCGLSDNCRGLCGRRELGLRVERMRSTGLGRALVVLLLEAEDAGGDSHGRTRAAAAAGKAGEVEMGRIRLAGAGSGQRRHGRSSGAAMAFT